MGIFTDLANDGVAIGPNPSPGLDRSSRHQLLSRAAINDPTLSANFFGVNQETILPEQTDAGLGDEIFIRFTLWGVFGGLNVKTANFAYDSTAAQIEAAIDLVAAGLIPGWSNGDISVSSAGVAGFSDGDVEFLFDGTSVEKTAVTTFLGATGFTKTTGQIRNLGQQDRPATQALFELNVVEGELQFQGEPPFWDRPASNGQSRPRYGLIYDLAAEASREDGNDLAIREINRLYPRV